MNCPEPIVGAGPVGTVTMTGTVGGAGHAVSGVKLVISTKLSAKQAKKTNGKLTLKG